MPVSLRCPAGHTWEGNALSADRGARCPVCGAAVNLTEVYPGTRRAEEDTSPTILDSGAQGAPAPAGADAVPHLADFEIQEELGRGGMGIVYKARWRTQNRVVAIKVIRRDRLQHEEAVRRFRREAHAACRLDHPNIVQVFESDHGGDTHYIVMEYVDGVTLERLVEARGPLPIATACDYMRQAALGLQHAHEQALVHRDIKPANLIVTPPIKDNEKDAAPRVVKILDMGVARLLALAGAPPGESFSTMTQGGTVIGTADYIAPEQLEDPHKADIRADLYSLGCTFYYVLTGQVPFPGGSLISKLDKQRWQTPTAVDELRVDIPATLANVIRKLLAKKPTDRFGTPAELAHALEDLVRSDFTGAASRLAIKELRRFSGESDVVSAVAFSPDGNRAVSGGKERLIHVWDTASGRVLQTFAKQTQEIRAVAWSPEGTQLAWAAGVSIRLGDPSTGQEQHRLGGHSDAVRALAFTAEGQRLVSAAEDKTVRLWDMPTRREVIRMARHTAGVTSCAAAPDGSIAVSGGRDQTLRVWDLRHGQELRVMAPSAGTVLALALSPDAHLALSAHFDTLVRLWDVQSGRELRRFHGHKQMVTGVAFTSDGKRLVTGSHDQTVRLWQVETGLELASVSLGTGVTALAVAADGKAVLVAAADRSLRLLALP